MKQIEEIEHQNFEHSVRLAAYALWEQEGRPDGQDARHWEEAKKEVIRRVQRATDTGESAGNQNVTEVDKIEQDPVPDSPIPVSSERIPGKPARRSRLRALF